MFNVLLSDLKAFVEERDWLKYHTPRNMATTLFVESSELLEHFLPHNNLSRQDLENEFGDVLHCILLTMQALGLSPPETLPDYKISKTPLIDFSTKVRSFMNHFLWLKEGEPYRGDLTELYSLLKDLLALHFLLCKELQMDPFKVTYHKLELNKKKYPVELVKGPVEKYFLHKKSLSDIVI